MAALSSPFSALRAASFTFEELQSGIYVGGQGDPLLLIHGSGPGASSIGNWRLVLDRLASRYSVIAMDLIGFGSSDRRAEPPYFDFELWVRQAKAALDLFGRDKIGVIGHSISGAIALRIAAEDTRVNRVMTTGTMGARMPVTPALSKIWRCPASREEMRSAAQALIADDELITDAYLDARMEIIGSEEYRLYFDTMFEGDFEHYINAAVVSDDILARVSVPVMMLHGREDLAFPAETGSLALLDKMPDADCMLLGRCSHSIAMERTETFLSAIHNHFARQDER
ncbi:alpha/beta fold hydrolase [Parasphingopyxis lamellibrachiae]|uniref:2-hydroxymuconate semialdehyde hydrolase n=1 Tax=Parasphingopyxis lamellibrachiae TaxID=680125 RepID=A0A3D9FAK5_9SPHN|nr:alpha/beta hydrolase [Parasphingopyxis lamellibrachiae]RED13357.1 2-hydroxymuconate semialdehyde hydrolase [Parasphingopyxis lamellibrachiae]